MPASLTYPGVYLEEVPSGVRPIAGVATSLAAFVGWAARGPTDRAVLITSWSDFERQFGGLDARSLLGYSAYHFFNNGGALAYIVRLVADGQNGTTAPATASVTFDTGAVAPNRRLVVSARNPGAWANRHRIRIRDVGGGRFRLAVLEVVDGNEVEVEPFESISMVATDARYVVNVLREESQLVTADNPDASTTIPSNTTDGSSPGLGSTVAGTDGTVLNPDTADFERVLQATGTGYSLLDRVDLFNLLCVPGETTPSVLQTVQAFARAHRAFVIADCDDAANFASLQNGPNASLTGNDAINAAFYFPWVNAPDSLQQGRSRAFPPCGFIAGIYSRTDAQRGVWKAPAGTEASLTGATSLAQTLNDLENGQLNIRAVNCLRLLPPYGHVVWGSRTLRGNNDVGSEWKYVPVRRTALFLEESLRRGLQWVVFEPNDAPLWAQIRLNVGSFLQGLFRQGAFQGSSPREAYFVKCDAETTTAADQNLGIVNILVGFAPLKPAEFVVLKIQQIAGQTAA